MDENESARFRSKTGEAGGESTNPRTGATGEPSNLYKLRPQNGDAIQPEDFDVTAFNASRSIAAGRHSSEASDAPVLATPGEQVSTDPADVGENEVVPLHAKPFAVRPDVEGGSHDLAEPSLPAPLRVRGRERLLPRAVDSAGWLGYFVALFLSVLVTVAFAGFVHHYYAPGPGMPGIDENVYLLAGKNIVDGHTTGFKPSSEYNYVSAMWFVTDSGWYYPKYPFGVPLLNAIAILIGGTNNAAFVVSPVCATTAVLGMFFLTRRLAGAWAGLIATVLMAANPVLLYLSLVPSSHAPAIAFVVWGMFALVSWAQGGRTWVGIVAGLLLGFAVTIRYTEGLLVLPILFLAVTTLAWSRRRSYLRMSAPLLAWALPVLVLFAFNWFSSHTFTGYDSTNESDGFSLAHFRQKWEYTIAQLNSFGLLLGLPLGLVGMAFMFVRTSRAATVLLLWVLPSLVLYTAYYWGIQTPGIGYLRFFLTVLPPFAIGAAWLVVTVGRSVVSSSPGYYARVKVSVVSVVLVGMVASAGVYAVMPSMVAQYVNNANLAQATEVVLTNVPEARRGNTGPKPVFFVEDIGMFSKVLMHLQFAGDGEWMSANAFNLSGAGQLLFRGRGRTGDPDQLTPVLVQPKRSEMMNALYHQQTAGQLADAEKSYLKDVFDAGRPVYAVLTARMSGAMIRRYEKIGLDAQELARWSDAVELPTDGEGRGGSGNADRGGRSGRPGGGRSGGGSGITLPGNRMFVGAKGDYVLLRITRQQ